MKFLCAFLFFAKICLLPLGTDEYLLSSEPLTEMTSSSLEGYQGFVFVPLIHIDAKDKTSIMTWIEQELKKKGLVKKEVFLTRKGADFNTLAHPFLTFSLEQIVTQDKKHPAIVKATLYTSSSVTVAINHKSKVLPTNEWSIYLKKGKPLDVIKKSFPALLERFFQLYYSDNPKDKKPIFYLVVTTD